eukprot:TRINITY_DN2353_c0_g1_i1.p1 TRINITY_DN2353_c0_g1~~TRINITY_DN2353_c0_g1_i1.p1  ORF type:complete len:282 (+),score=64.21 TRINITY_DN2353_c0_g1_i1:353-1198(+)
MLHLPSLPMQPSSLASTVLTASSSTTIVSNSSNMAYSKKMKIMAETQLPHEASCRCHNSPTLAELVRSAYNLNQRIKAKGSEQCLRQSVLQRRLWRQLRAVFFDPAANQPELTDSPALSYDERRNYPCQCHASIKGQTTQALAAIQAQQSRRASILTSTSSNVAAAKPKRSRTSIKLKLKQRAQALPAIAATPINGNLSREAGVMDVDKIATSIKQFRATQPMTGIESEVSASSTSPDLDSAAPLPPPPSTPYFVRARARRPCPVRSPEGVAVVFVATSDL